MANLNYRGKVSLDITGFKAAAKTMKAEINGLRSSFMGFVGGLGASLGISGLVSKMRETATGLNVARATLENVSKGTGEYGENLRFVDQMSKRYHQDLITLTDSFSRFHAAAMGTNFSLEQQKDMYEGLVRAATYFHMSSERTENMLIAVEQMMSKGKVTAEELRRQLGNNLPGAYAKMAQAAIQTGYAGVKSFADFEKAMKNGQIGVDLLTDFIKNLNEETQHFNTDSLVLKANDLKNAFINFVDGSQFEDFLKGVYDKTTDLLGWLSEHFTNLVKKAEVLFGGLLTVKLVKWLATAWKAYSSFFNKIIASFPALTKTLSIHASSWKRILATLRSGISKGGFVGAFVAVLAAAGIAITDATKKSREWKKALSEVKDELRAIDSINWKKDDDPWSKREAAQQEVDKAEKFLSENYDNYKNWKTRYNSIVEPNSTGGWFGNGIRGAGASQNYAMLAAKERDELETRINTYDAMKKLYQTAQKRVWAAEAEIRQLSSGDTITTDNTLTDGAENKFQKALQKFIDGEKELENQRNNHSITLDKYNAEMNDLVEKSWLAITAFDDFREELAKLTSDEQEAGVRLEKAFGELGLTKSIESVTDAAQDYFKELVKQNALKQSNLTTDEEYDKALLKASETAVEAMSAIKNLEAVLSYLDPITRQVIGSIFEQYNRLHQAEITKKQGEFAADINDLRQAPNLPARWAYRDTTSQFFTKMANSYESKLEKYKELVKDVMEDMTLLGSMTLEELDAIGEDLKNKAQNFRDLADLTEWADELQKLKTEWRTSLTDNIVSTTDTMMGLVNSSMQLRDTLDDVKKTDWEKFMAVWDHLIGVFQTIRNLQEMIMSLQKAQEAFSAAKEAKELRALNSQYFLGEELLAQKKQEIALDAAAAGQSAANTSASLAEQSALAGKAIAGATASGAKMAFPYNLIAIAAGVSAVLSGLAFIKKFASGGIVKGSLNGDRNIIGVNGNEMILNGNQQGRLWNLINHGGTNTGGKQQVEFKIAGKDLVGVIKNYNTITKG